MSRIRSLSGARGRARFLRGAGPGCCFHVAFFLLVAACGVLVSAGGGPPPDEAEAFLAIDYGSEWIKIAVMRGGKADIVLNENSKRKSLAALSFADGPEALRQFGESAMARPQHSLQYVRELLGKYHRGGGVATVGPHTFPAAVQADPERGGLQLVRSATEIYSAEALNAMLLTYARERAEEHSGISLHKCVIAVPAYFADEERRSLLAAARIAGLDVLALVSDIAAVALLHGLDGVAGGASATARSVLLYDMGATSTTAAVAQFEPPPPSSPSAGAVRVLAAAWDTSLGGSTLTELLRDALVAAAPADPRGDTRAMARLRKEAGKAKEVLSANKEVSVQARPHPPPICVHVRSVAASDRRARLRARRWRTLSGTATCAQRSRAARWRRPRARRACQRARSRPRTRRSRAPARAPAPRRCRLSAADGACRWCGRRSRERWAPRA